MQLALERLFLKSLAGRSPREGPALSLVVWLPCSISRIVVPLRWPTSAWKGRKTLDTYATKGLGVVEAVTLQHLQTFR